VCCVPEVEENNWSTPRTDSPFVFDGFVWLEVVLLDAVLWVLLWGAVLKTTKMFHASPSKPSAGQDTT
jgi:hypothetical protein